MPLFLISFSPTVSHPAEEHIIGKREMGSAMDSCAMAELEGGDEDMRRIGIREAMVASSSAE